MHLGAESDAVDLVLLLDKSGSTQPVVAEILLGAETRWRWRGRATRSEVPVPFTSRMEEIGAGLRRILRQEDIRGGTDIGGAVLEAARYMRAQPRTEARRSILILTDNRSYKTRRDETVLRELWEADAVLKAARTYQQVVNPLGLLLSANVNRFVDGTGGESLAGQAPAGPAGKRRTIRVTLSPEALKGNPRASVRARRGYVPREAVP